MEPGEKDCEGGGVYIMYACLDIRNHQGHHSSQKSGGHNQSGGMSVLIPQKKANNAALFCNLYDFAFHFYTFEKGIDAHITTSTHVLSSVACLTSHLQHCECV